MTLLDPAVIAESTRLAFEGRLSFPEAVARLRAVGVERYEVDLVRREKTFWSACGGSERQAMPAFDAPVPAAAFSPEGVEAAVRASQRGELGYPEFLRRVMAAGTVSYAVYLDGRQALYFGRDGACHREVFPGR